MLTRLKKLVSATIDTSAERLASSKRSAASAQISSVTASGWSARRVIASVSAKAARSAASNSADSLHAGSASSRSVPTPALAADSTPAAMQALQPLIWLARRRRARRARDRAREHPGHVGLSASGSAEEGPSMLPVR